MYSLTVGTSFQPYSNLEHSVQTASSTGQEIPTAEGNRSPIIHQPHDPVVDPSTGEWILSEYDIECMAIGAAILGCGGGGNPHIGKCIALNAIQKGKQMSIITPER